MNYDHSISMANIDNVIVALNKGGVLSCEDLMERIWNDATIAQVNRKINAPRNVMLHNAEYARKQLKQEIRRSLHTYFNEIGTCNHGIHRIQPVHDVEHFYVSSVHTRVAPEVVEESLPEPSIMSRLQGNLTEGDIAAARGVDALLETIDEVWNNLGGPND